MPTNHTGLTHTRTEPLNAISLDGNQPPSQLWADLSRTPAFQDQLIAGVRELLTGVAYQDAVATLVNAGITAANGGLARLLADFGLADCREGWWRALRVVTQIGQGTVTPLGRLGFEALATGPVVALAAADSVPTIAVQLDNQFRERRRDQREQILEILATVATAVDVRLVCSTVLSRWLATEHRATLPIEFSDSCSAGPQTDTNTDECAMAALEKFDADSREVEMLRQLADDPSDTVSYAALKKAHADVGAGRISQVLSSLEERNLIQKWGPRREKRIDLLPAGAQVVDRFDALCGRQQSLSELSDTGHSSKRDVLSQPRGRGGPGPSAQSNQEDSEKDVSASASASASACDDASDRDGNDSAPYSTRYLSLSSHQAAAGTAKSGSISLVPAQIPDCEDAYDRHIRYVSFLEERDEAVVAVRATTPFQYIVSLALSLASPRFLDKALPVERLDEIDDPPAILRDARCIGGLSDVAIESSAQLRSNIQEWAGELSEMTTDLKHGEYKNRTEFCGEILRTAHGLAGSIVHLLDCVGIELIRELRLPGSLSSEQYAAIARTVAVGVSIQSQYGAFATYRQLFEQREEKRRAALTPTVDAEDPVGTHIGSLVVRSPAVDRFEPCLTEALESPGEVHETAPEIAVQIPVSRARRRGYAEVATRVCRSKKLRPTREVVDVLQALTRSPYAVADAIRWLGGEDQPRELRFDELRVALRKLTPDRLLAEAPPTVGKIVSALLSACKPLSQSEVAERADVSVRSLRRHTDVLQALDLVRVSEGESKRFRLSLPFRESEKGERILPVAAKAESARKAAQEVAFEVAIELISIEEAGRLAMPDDPLGAPFCGPPIKLRTKLRRLTESRPQWESWLQVAQRLAGTQAKTPDEIQFGAKISQQSLTSCSV